MKLSDYIIRTLENYTGSKHAFLLSGGGMMHLLESLGRSRIQPIPTHHEQAAAIAADAYSRINNTIGICFVTTGPGGTNAITGVAGAYMDSNPVIFISGQVSRANSKSGLQIRQRGIQEVEMVPIVQSITKYAVLVENPKEIRFHLEKALYLARSGRPGPVWLDIPLDVQAAQIEPDELQGFDSKDLEARENPTPTPHQIDEILDALCKAERPLLILGGGIQTSGARSLVDGLIKALQVPVQTSWNGMDLLPENSPWYVGRANTFGPRYANLIVQNADLLLILGARLGMQHTGYNISAFGRGAFKIMVDVDPSEMTKPGIKIDLPIKADVKKTIEKLISRASEFSQIASLKRDKISTWMQYCRKVKEKYPIAPLLEQIFDERYVNPYSFAVELSRVLPNDAVVPIGSSGMGHTVTGGVFEVKSGQRVFTSKGLAAMGYGLPSTLGACFASNKRMTVSIIGDGGFQLNIQELQTIRHYRLPIKLFIFNNEGYHSIRMTQKNYFGGHFVGSTPDSGVSLPDLKKLADLYEFSFFKIEKNQEVRNGIRDVLNSSGPVLCEVMIDPEKALEPKLASYQQTDGTMQSRPLEDMAPLLDREELRQNMFIPLVTD